MRQSYVRFEMQERLKSTDRNFEKLTLTIQEYDQYKIDKGEICINGKMYDIKSSHARGDKIELTVLNDIEEENILQRIKDLIANNNSNPFNEVPSQLTDLMDLDYVHSGNTIQIVFSEQDQQKFKEFYQSHNSFHPDVLSPPPRLA